MKKPTPTSSKNPTKKTPPSQTPIKKEVSKTPIKKEVSKTPIKKEVSKGKNQKPKANHKSNQKDKNDIALCDRLIKENETISRNIENPNQSIQSPKTQDLCIKEIENILDFYQEGNLFQYYQAFFNNLTLQVQQDISQQLENTINKKIDPNHIQIFASTQSNKPIEVLSSNHKTLEFFQKITKVDVTEENLHTLKAQIVNISWIANLVANTILDDKEYSQNFISIIKKITFLFIIRSDKIISGLKKDQKKLHLEQWQYFINLLSINLKSNMSLTCKNNEDLRDYLTFITELDAYEDRTDSQNSSLLTLLALTQLVAVRQSSDSDQFYLTFICSDLKNHKEIDQGFLKNFIYRVIQLFLKHFPKYNLHRHEYVLHLRRLYNLFSFIFSDFLSDYSLIEKYQRLNNSANYCATKILAYKCLEFSQKNYNDLTSSFIYSFSYVLHAIFPYLNDTLKIKISNSLINQNLYFPLLHEIQKNKSDDDLVLNSVVFSIRMLIDSVNTDCVEKLNLKNLLNTLSKYKTWIANLPVPLDSDSDSYKNYLALIADFIELSGVLCYLSITQKKLEKEISSFAHDFLLLLSNKNTKFQFNSNNLIPLLRSCLLLGLRFTLDACNAVLKEKTEDLQQISTYIHELNLFSDSSNLVVPDDPVSSLKIMSSGLVMLAHIIDLLSNPSFSDTKNQFIKNFFNILDWMNQLFKDNSHSEYDVSQRITEAATILIKSASIDNNSFELLLSHLNTLHKNHHLTLTPEFELHCSFIWSKYQNVAIKNQDFKELVAAFFFEEKISFHFTNLFASNTKKTKKSSLTNIDLFIDLLNHDLIDPNLTEKIKNHFLSALKEKNIPQSTLKSPSFHKLINKFCHPNDFTITSPNEPLFFYLLQNKFLNEKMIIKILDYALNAIKINNDSLKSWLTPALSQLEELSSLSFQEYKIKVEDALIPNIHKLIEESNRKEDLFIPICFHTYGHSCSRN